MTRARKIWLGIGIGAFTLGAAIVAISRPPARFSDTISFLKGIRPFESNSTLQDLTGLMVYPVGTRSPVYQIVFDQERFVVPGDFTSVSERAKLELKPRSMSAASYPTHKPTTVLYAFKDSGRTIVVNFSAKDKDHTLVVVTTNREPTWFEKAKFWVSGLFGHKPRTRHWERA